MNLKQTKSFNYRLFTWRKLVRRWFPVHLYIFSSPAVKILPSVFLFRQLSTLPLPIIYEKRKARSWRLSISIPILFNTQWPINRCEWGEKKNLEIDSVCRTLHPFKGCSRSQPKGPCNQRVPAINETQNTTMDLSLSKFLAGVVLMLSHLTRFNT